MSAILKFTQFVIYPRRGGYLLFAAV